MAQEIMLYFETIIDGKLNSVHKHPLSVYFYVLKTYQPIILM